MMRIQTATLVTSIALLVAACSSGSGTPSQQSDEGGGASNAGGSAGNLGGQASGATGAETTGANTTGGTRSNTTEPSNGGAAASGGATTNPRERTNVTGGSSGEGGTTGKTATTGKGGDTTGRTTATSGTGGGGAYTGPLGKQGERYPFPQNVKYPYGVQSTKVTSDHVRSWYDNWKKNHLVSCNGNLMPAADSSNLSKVEAQGFAMIAVAYMGDKDVFDKLYGFYVSKTNSAACGLSAWKTDCDGLQDPGAATDGDIDVASGLIVAHWQWPDAGYDAKARTVITHLRQMLTECSGKWTVYPGCSGGRPWGGCNETDISYYSPAFFRYFAQISGDAAWSKLADDTHTIRDAAANASTGLVPDWQSVSGTPGAGSRAGYYGFDAIRTPYKHALDYLWNGNAAALAWTKKITTWAYGIGVKNIKDGYQLNGSVQGSYHNMAAVGSLAVASLANTQEIADAFVQESASIKDDYWYSSYLGNLYLLAMSGNMWNPDIVGK